jgi:pyruvate dehydrogenase E2 component (dihydrolipoamide acetyltransferase)
VRRIVRLPDLGEGVARAEVVDVLVSKGETVREDQALAEVESDKATVQIPSPYDGVVVEILCAAGARLEVGEPLLYIDATGGSAGEEEAEEPAAATAGAAPGPATAEGEATGGVRAAPRTRALAARLGVRLDDLAPARRGKVVQEADVLAAAKGVEQGPGQNRVPLRGVRREIAERLTEASRVPTVTVVEECDFTNAEGLSGYERSGWIVKTTADALAEHPLLNSTLEEGEVITHRERHICWAVQTKRGLMAPVLRNVEDLSLEELAGQVRRVVRAARSGTLAIGDLRGGTFTITDAGRLGGLFATPLLNPPQTAIVGVHRLARRPVARGDSVVVGVTGLVSCTFDHRAFDGADASAMLVDLVERFAAGPR